MAQKSLMQSFSYLIVGIVFHINIGALLDVITSGEEGLDAAAAGAECMVHHRGEGGQSSRQNAIKWLGAYL